MNLYIKNGKVLINGRFQKTNITIQKGKITSLSETSNLNRLPELDASCSQIVPGFIDIHTHGGNGVDVNNATSQDLGKISSFFASQGTTSWLASIATDTEEKTLWCINQISRAMDEPISSAQLLGIHLEGPFLSPAYKGAMAEHLLQKADISLFNRYQQAANDRVKYITVSPEVEGVPNLIKEICNSGVVIAIGHSGADYELSMECINNGVKSSTHTFNGMKLMHQHFPAITGAILESDIYCEAICDGRHLHPGIVRLLLKTKGFDRVIAVTDSMMAAGLNDGKYILGVNEVEVINGDAKLISDGTRAGSTLTTINSLKNLIQFTEKNLEDLIPLLTRNPAALLNIDGRKGTIAVDKDADLVLLDDDLNVETTIVMGNIVYQR